MMRKLLLFFGFLALVTSARGADAGAIVSISNIKNIVPGYSGSFDVVLNSSSTEYYTTLGLDVQLPDGFTYTVYTAGALLTESHASNIFRSDQGNNTSRFSSYANPTADFTAKQGVLLTIHFTVDAAATTGTAWVKNASFTLGTESCYATDASAELTVTNVLTLDEDATEAPMAGSNLNVKINRTLYADRWHTIVLPFAVSASQVTAAFGAGTQIGYFKGYTFADPNISVNFEARTEMAAHTPYIIKVPATIDGFTVEGVDITTLGEDEVPQVAYGEEVQVPAGKNKYINVYQGNDMVGTYIPIDIEDGNLFLLNNQFMFSKGNSKLKAFRAYFSFWDAEYDSSAREFIINFDDTVTGISNVSASTPDADGDIFNLSGQRVTEPAKGLYIRGGQKLIIK
jgi:hypothetical protein